MGELIHEALRPINLVYTTMFAVLALYWLMVILGALDIDFLNIDLDADFDADVDVDFDVDADVDVDMDADADIDGGGPGLLTGFLQFFYVGEMPVMILVSIMVLSLWTIGIGANHYINADGGLLMALSIGVVNTIAGLMIVKIVGLPIHRLFRSLDGAGKARRDVIGCICSVVTTSVSEHMGQAEVATGGAPIRINAVTDDGSTLDFGDEAVVVCKDTKTGVYTIAPMEK